MKKKPNIFPRVGSLLRGNRQDQWVILALVVITILIVTPTVVQRILVPGGSDFVAHIRFTKSMLAQQYQDVPASVYAHPLYQILLIAIYSLSFQLIGLFPAAVLIQVAAQVMTVLLIYFWLGRPEKKNGNWLRAGWAVTLILVAPIMAFVFWDKLFYLGYIGLANYHNPTIVLLRPAAVAGFICALRIFSDGKRSSWKFTLLSAFLTVLAGLIKPNFAICILPALGLMAGLYWIWKKLLDWRLLFFGFLLPGTLLLGAQLVLAYFLPGDGGDGIMFDPLGVMKGFSGFLFPKFLLSILFPLTILVLNYRQVRKDEGLLLAWLGFLVSAVQTYFLAESGLRHDHGNFLWSSQIMLFLLFIASVRYLWREKFFAGSWVRWDNMIMLIAYAAHLCAGMAYYVYSITKLWEYPV